MAYGVMYFPLKYGGILESGRMYIMREMLIATQCLYNSSGKAISESSYTEHSYWWGTLFVECSSQYYHLTKKRIRKLQAVQLCYITINYVKFTIKIK